MVAAATVPGILQSGTHASRPLATAMAVGGLYSCTTHAIIYVSDGTAWTNWGLLGLYGTAASALYVIDGGGLTLTTGSKGYIEIPFSGTITAVRMQADSTGSIVIDVKKATYSGLPTTSSICASAKPTLSSARKMQDSTLTGWTTTVTAGDWLEFNVDSVSSLTRIVISLTIVRT